MGLTALGKADEKNTGKMGKILEKLMKKYWKNAKNTGKVYEKILEKCKKNLEKSGKFVSPKKWEPCVRNECRKQVEIDVKL